jgi:hypothetical protein
MYAIIPYIRIVSEVSGYLLLPALPLLEQLETFWSILNMKCSPF